MWLLLPRLLLPHPQMGMAAPILHDLVSQWTIGPRVIRRQTPAPLMPLLQQTAVFTLALILHRTAVPLLLQLKHNLLLLAARQWNPANPRRHCRIIDFGGIAATSPSFAAPQRPSSYFTLKLSKLALQVGVLGPIGSTLQPLIPLRHLLNTALYGGAPLERAVTTAQVSHVVRWRAVSKWVGGRGTGER